MYKIAHGIFPGIMNELFQPRGEYHYDLRYTSEFIIPPIHNVYHGSESVSYLGPKIWKLIPPVIRQIDYLSGLFEAQKYDFSLIPTVFIYFFPNGHIHNVVSTLSIAVKRDIENDHFVSLLK